MKNSGVYMIINNVNLKVYVGSSVELNKRKIKHFSQLKNNTHHNRYLQNSYNKYGKENFSFIILEDNINKEELFKKESEWIFQKDSLNPLKGYNLDIPQKDERLSLSPEILQNKIIKAYNQWYGDNPIISLEEFLNGKRAKDLIEKLGPQNKKKVYAFNKETGIKEYEFESITDTANKLNVKITSVEKVLSKDNSTCKGLILVKEEDYDSNKNYIKTYKTQPYKPKGKFKGHPVETFNIETNETVMKFDNKYDMAKYYNTSLKYVNKVFNKEKNHLKTFGVRYTK